MGGGSSPAIRPIASRLRPGALSIDTAWSLCVDNPTGTLVHPWRCGPLALPCPLSASSCCSRRPLRPGRSGGPGRDRVRGDHGGHAGPRAHPRDPARQAGRKRRRGRLREPDLPRAHARWRLPRARSHQRLFRAGVRPVVRRRSRSELLPAAEPDRGLPVHQDARRHAAGGDGPATAREDDGRRAVPDRGRVLGLRDGRPRQPAAGVAARQRARVRDRRREHARLRVLGRGVRPVRPAHDGRWLRHRRGGRCAALGPEREGRPGRDLVLRHQPALRRRRAAAAPAGDGSAVGHRRHLPLAGLPRRHLQQRLRGDLAPGSRQRRPAGAPGWPAVCHRPRERRRPDLSREPAPPSSDSGSRAADGALSLLHAVGDGQPVAHQLGAQYRGADVPGRLVAGRADGR